MSTHKITACRSGFSCGMDWEAEYEITFSYTPGSPDTYDPGRGGPGGWDPGYGPELEYISHMPESDYGPAAKDEADWCREWLYEHADQCADVAEDQMLPDPDAARDARIDDELTGRTDR